MTFINVNGINVYYVEAGSGEPLLLIHGTGFNADVWDGVFAPLAGHFRTIAYDRRGYQRTQGQLPPSARYGQQQGEDIVALLQALRAEPATLLGWSAGGIHALYATLQCPELVKRLILYEPPLYYTKFIDLPAMNMFLRLNVQKAIGRRQAAANVFVRWVLAYRDGRNSYDRLSPEFRAKLRGDTEAMLAEFAGGTGEDLAPEVLKEQIKVPVTLLVGDQSWPSIHKMAQNLAGILNAPVIELHDANHLAQVDQPEAFVSAIMNILA